MITNPLSRRFAVTDAPLTGSGSWFTPAGCDGGGIVVRGRLWWRPTISTGRE